MNPCTNCLFDRLRSKNHNHVPSFQLCRLFNDAELGAGGSKTLHNLLSQFGMLNLTAAETQGNLYLISATEETARVVLLGLKIVLLNANTELNFLDGNDLLILPCVLFPFCLLKAVLAVIHNLTDGGICLGRNLYKIQSLVIRDLLCIAGGLNPQLCAVGINQANLSVSDLFVELKLFCADGKTPPNKKKIDRAENVRR